MHCHVCGRVNEALKCRCFFDFWAAKSSATATSSVNKHMLSPDHQLFRAMSILRPMVWNEYAYRWERTVKPARQVFYGNQVTRMVDALMVTVSRHVIRVENTVTTSNLEALEVDLNDTTSNYFLLSLLVLTCFLHLPSSEYVSMIKRLRRKLLYMYSKIGTGSRTCISKSTHHNFM